MSSETLPRKLYELNRTIVVQTTEWASAALKNVGGSASRVVEASRNAGATVVGQTRSVVERTTTTGRDGAREVVGQTRAAVERTTTTARHGASEVAGQTEAQGAKVAAQADREAKRLVDQATKAVDGMPTSGTAYEDWTREQLYRRSQELEIEGRASMSKAQLIKALRR